MKKVFRTACGIGFTFLSTLAIANPVISYTSNSVQKTEVEAGASPNLDYDTESAYGGFSNWSSDIFANASWLVYCEAAQDTNPTSTSMSGDVYVTGRGLCAAQSHCAMEFTVSENCYFHLSGYVDDTPQSDQTSNYLVELYDEDADEYLSVDDTIVYTTDYFSAAGALIQGHTYRFVMHVDILGVDSPYDQEFDGAVSGAWTAYVDSNP